VQAVRGADVDDVGVGCIVEKVFEGVEKGDVVVRVEAEEVFGAVIAEGDKLGVGVAGDHFGVAFADVAASDDGEAEFSVLRSHKVVLNREGGIITWIRGDYFMGGGILEKNAKGGRGVIFFGRI
jgi:hypothetical protein